MNQQRKFFVLLALFANFAAQLSAQKLLPVSVAVSTKYQLSEGQAPPAGAKPSLLAAQDPREPAVLAQCKNPPLSAPDYGQPQLGLRDYKVMEIPGVIAAGQKWQSLW